MIQTVVKTRDNTVRLYLHDDQTGEISDNRRVTIICRQPLYKIGQQLAEWGIDSTDLIPD